MMLSHILAFGLHYHIYHIVSRTTSTQELEHKLNHISLSEMYAHQCEQEWNRKQFPQGCIFLVEASVDLTDRSPRTVRGFINSYCNQSMDWTQISISTLINIQQQPYIRHYPRCHRKLKEKILDREYKTSKNVLLQTHAQE